MPLVGGLWLSACLPPPEADGVKYDISSYTAAPGDSGSLAGTWVLTSNKPYAEADLWPSVKSRAVFRLKSVEGSPNQLELVYCHPDHGFQVSTADLDSGQLTLNITTDSPAYTAATVIEAFNVADNSHLQKTVVTAGGVEHQFHAIKISNDSELSIGTVNVSFPVILKTAINQSAKCLLEINSSDGYQTDHVLMASGTNGLPLSATGHLIISEYADQTPSQSYMFSAITDENYAGSLPGDVVTSNTVKSTAHSIKGSAAAVYYSDLPAPIPVGSTTFNITL